MSSKSNFMSDNVSGACPEVMDALIQANEDNSPSYGDDPWTKELTVRLQEIFETPVTVFPLTTGTAANALALSTLTPVFGKIYCHELAHINTDECGAPEMFTGGAKIIDIPGENGRISAESLERTIYGAGNVHHAQPATVSITQACESGTVYSLDEIRSITSVAHAHSLHMHMDGARFANAIATLGVTPAQMTWQAGIDVLSFGGTKNGCLAAEAVVFFKPELVGDFPFLQKRAGQLVSKSRFISSQFTGYLSNDVWLRNARHANAMAQRLSKGMARLPGLELAYPTESNEVFVKIPTDLIERLWAQHLSINDEELDGKAVRFVTAWNTTESQVDDLLQLIATQCEPS
ncbi:low specificity L-threonine aldolase [Gammaproteobacteria bacterium]|jgi:threonine aldolase|nr:low specificity L-threonine aldolase [Gammaproteobacteria bacterium]MDC1097293.1 low specificity L-threonine aldolase [Gammaproteobacteria bacterium]